MVALPNGSEDLRAASQLADFAAMVGLDGVLRQAGMFALRVQTTPVLKILEHGGTHAMLCGVSLAQLLADPTLWWQLVHPEDRSTFDAAIASASPQTLVVRTGMAPTTTWQWAEHAIVPWRTQTPSAAGFVVLVRNVSGRVEALAELEHTREILDQTQRDRAYFQTLIRTVNDGILVNDVDGRIEFANLQLATLLRTTPDAMIGRHIFDYMDRESADTARENLRRRRKGEEDQFDFRWRRNDGSEFWSIVAAKPLLDDAGNHRGSLVAITDITRRKHAEDAVVRARDELERRVAERTQELALEVQERRRAEAAAQSASRTKSLFLANMSHELRTPLNAIIGYAELTLEECDPEAAQLRVDIERIRGSAEHLLGLINSILDLSKIEAAKVEVRADTFVLGEFVADLRSTILPMIVKGQNRLQASCSAESRTIITDRTKLKQIVLNLLSNACKFTQRGWIDLRVDLTDDDGVAWLEVEVADTGIGIPEHKLDNLFHVFAQADDSVARRFGGTGLGLAISRELCRLLGGDVNVQSTVGQGTAFLVRLPVQTPAG